jgi:hypothetical protein
MMISARVVGRVFGVAGGEVPELLEPVEAALDHVAAGVDERVEGPWSAAMGAFGATALDLVGSLGAGEGDPALARRCTGRGMGVRLVGHDPLWACAGRPGPSRLTAIWSSSGSS